MTTKPTNEPTTKSTSRSVLRPLPSLVPTDTAGSTTATTADTTAGTWSSAGAPSPTPALLKPPPRWRVEVRTVAADDLRYLSACIAIDLTGVRYALPVPRAHEAPGADHHWQWDTGRTEDGWTGLYDVAGESHHDDSVTQELRDSLAEEFVMLRIENVVEPHTTSRQASERHVDRIIAVHHRELLPTQIRTTQNPTPISTAQIDGVQTGAAQIGAAGPGTQTGGSVSAASAVSAAATAAGASGASRRDGIGAALAAAARSNRAVALALSDGTRLNGIPQLDPDTDGSGIVRLSEEHGQEPFTVRLDHVIYVRVLGGLGAPGNSSAADSSGAAGSRAW